MWGGGNPDLHGTAGSATQPGSWGLPQCRGMLSSLRLLKPGYNYLLQADKETEPQPWIPPSTFTPSPLMCQEHACLRSCIPSFRNATSPCWPQCCHFFQVRSQSPRTHPALETSASSRFSLLLAVSITHSVLGMDCLVP